MLALLLIGLAILGLAWFLTIPIRFAFRLVFGLIFGLLRFVLRLVFSPLILLVVGVCMVVALILGVVTHLLPLVLLGLAIWGIYRFASGRCATI